MILVLNDKEYDDVWNRVYDELGFAPSCAYRGHSLNVSLPFALEGEYAIYEIDDMTEDQMDILAGEMPEILNRITPKGDKTYALDWQHKSFLFDVHTDDPWNHPNDGQYHPYLPSFYPDGDYYFYIDENFRFGYLGHPWRQEVWAFGADMIKELDEAFERFGWTKIK